MNRKYFFKRQSSLQRKAIAGGLAATFCAGVFSSFEVAAMQLDVTPQPGFENNNFTNLTGEELQDVISCTNFNPNYDFLKKIDLEYEEIKKIFPKEEELLKILMDDLDSKRNLEYKAYWENRPIKILMDDLDSKRNLEYKAYWENRPSRKVLIFALIHNAYGLFDKIQSKSAKEHFLELVHRKDSTFGAFLKTTLKNHYEKKIGEKFLNIEDGNEIPKFKEKKDDIKVVNIDQNIINNNKNDINSLYSSEGETPLPFCRKRGMPKNYELSTLHGNTTNQFMLREDISRKNLVRKKIIWSISAGVFLVSVILLIVYFTILRGNKQKTNETVDPANGQSGDNRKGNNVLKPTEQKHQTEENPGVVQGTGISAKILKGSVVGATGAGLATSGTCLYGKMSSEVKEPKKQKAQNGNKEKDNGSFTCVDSLEKVVAKNE